MTMFLWLLLPLVFPPLYYIILLKGIKREYLEHEVLSLLLGASASRVTLNRLPVLSVVANVSREFHLRTARSWLPVGLCPLVEGRTVFSFVCFCGLVLVASRPTHYCEQTILRSMFSVAPAIV